MKKPCMPLPIEIDPNGVHFCLQNLHGCIPFRTFINFGKPHSLERLLPLEKSDPNYCFQDLNALQEIHQTIKKISIDGTKGEELALRYWLASLFLLYFEIYHLDHEGSPCRAAWVHLLKLRYHSLMALYAMSEKEGEDEELSKEKIREQIPAALRTWRTFCQNPQNHFWFRQGGGFGCPEEEVWKIICGEDEGRREPHPFLLEDREGREVLRRRFISEWLLNDRYDWLKAFRLCCHYWRSRPKLGLIVFGVLLTVLVFLSVALTSFHMFGYFQSFQLFLFSLAVVAAFAAFWSESVIELLVPRLWAAVAVGYVPALMAGEIWETSIRISWGYVWPFFSASLLLSWLYLRWEIGNRMRQTLDLNKWVPFRRALVLLVIGVIIAFVLGLLILDFAGKPLIETYLSGGNSQAFLCREYSIQGLFSRIYPKMLLTFASIALLLGVVLQIFWHERPVTAPV
jgi:hypothetical protein